MKSSLVITALLALSLFPQATKASDNPIPLKQKVSEFLNIPKKRIFLECPSNEIDFPILDGQKTMRFCLNKSDTNNRCEVSIKDLNIAPNPQKISFDFKVENSAPTPKKWFSLMQIHSFPDEGESWRCPPFSLEYYKNTLRLFNRWDSNKISKTGKNTCAEPETSIHNKTIFSNIALEKWNKISLDLNLSYKDIGYIKPTLNNFTLSSLYGSNLYNDKRPPYLKLGIYKPTSWDKHHKMSCVTYRNIDISRMSE